MFRAPSLVANCSRRAVGLRLLRDTEGRAGFVVAQSLADETRVSAGNHHAPNNWQERQQGRRWAQQYRSVSNSTTSSSAREDSVGVPGSGEEVQGQSSEAVSAASPAPQEARFARRGAPAARLSTRIRSMFSHAGNGPWTLALHLLEKGRKEGIKDVTVYNLVLKMMAEDQHTTEKKMRHMAGLFDQMTNEDGLTPETHTYSYLIYGYSQAKDTDAAVRLQEEMLARGLQPDRRTLSSMIVAHSWRSVQEMRRVEAEMTTKGLQPTQRASSAMIGAFWRVHDLESVVRVTKSMVANEQCLKGSSLSVAIKSASKTGEAELARKLLSLHADTKHRPQEKLYILVMMALRSVSQHEQCLTCWRELVLLNGLGDIVLDPRTYDLALSSAVKVEKWEEMEGIFDMMEANGVHPTLATWRKLVDVWSKEETKDEARLDRIFGSMERRGWEATRGVRLHVATAYARCKIWHKAMAWFDPAMAEDVHFGSFETEHLIRSLGGTERHVEMKDVWTRYTNSKGGSLLRPSVLVKMAEAAREIEDPDWALELYEVSSRGPKISEHLWQDVVRVLTKTGKLEAAARVLQEIGSNESTPPATVEGIVAAFSKLANPAGTAAFVEELRAEVKRKTGSSEANVVDLERARAELTKPFATEDLEGGSGRTEESAAVEATNDQRVISSRNASQQSDTLPAWQYGRV